MNKPGQGFILGAKIKIRAIPYPLPAEVAADLIEAGLSATRARKVVEKIKEGCTPQKDAAIAEYDALIADMLTVEGAIRRTYGVEYIREEILPMKEVIK